LAGQLNNAAQVQIVPGHTMAEKCWPLAEAHVAEWGHLYPGWTVEDAYNDLLAESSTNPSSLEELLTSWIAVVEGDVVGTICLRGTGELEPDDAKQLTGPWLAALHVVPNLRRSGLATVLIDHVRTHASKLGFRRLRLVTEHEVSFYTRRGWTTETTVQLASNTNTVMVTSLLA